MMHLHNYQFLEYTIGNLEVESPNGSVPSLDTGLYLLSQEIPSDGRIKAVHACAFLIEPDANPQGKDQITIYFQAAVYRLINNNFKRVTGALFFFIIIEETHTFGCNVINLTMSEVEVENGDRPGVFIQQQHCEMISVLGQQSYLCPAHVNIMDPVKNCSQSLYFNNTRLEDAIPTEVNAVEGDPVDVFINIDLVVGKS